MAEEEKKVTEEEQAEAPKEEVKEEAAPAEEAKEEAPAEAAPADQADDSPEEVEVEIPDQFKDLIEKIEGLSVVELADLVKVLEKKFGVSAAAPVAAAGGAGGGEEKTEFNVMLQSAGSQKINAIKAVREITGLGLKEAKDIVEGAPKVLKEGVKKEEAEEMKKKLEEAGATAELQ